MPLKYFVSVFTALLIGYSISPSYSEEVIFCNGLESCPTNDGDAIMALTARVAALEALLADVSRDTDSNTGQDTLTFSAMNVQIVSGSDSTNGPVNGTGNLIIGYNEIRPEDEAKATCPSDAETEFFCNRRTGSHNLILGSLNNYSQYGGIVAGGSNEISAAAASVSGGSGNIASAVNASVSGGSDNKASGENASVSGGRSNTASWSYSSVSGGFNNHASNFDSSVSGGVNNTANGEGSSVSGGNGNNSGPGPCTTAGNIGTDCVP